MNFIQLDTSRLSLVQINKDHVESYYNIMSKDEVTKYYGMESLQSREEAEKMTDSFQTNFENKRGIRWGIIDKASSEFIGTVGLNNLNLPNKKAEIGYELHPFYWKKGITTEAVKEVLNYSFGTLVLHRIGAITFPENERSTQLLVRLGFSREGLIRANLYQNGEFHDTYIFSLLRPEWEKMLKEDNK
ncbi:GNAT family N-acetyltransferase [Alkalihalobacillus sp. 1P02AB]|uniref:GNAT family N-acetyltransferase n=1 Tax=Alkalihalobacillus sp. 1P02AB TaxID=3132260 RepID=UPI0039A52DCD